MSPDREFAASLCNFPGSRSLASRAEREGGRACVTVGNHITMYLAKMAVAVISDVGDITISIGVEAVDRSLVR